MVIFPGPAEVAIPPVAAEPVLKVPPDFPTSKNWKSIAELLFTFPSKLKVPSTMNLFGLSGVKLRSTQEGAFTSIFPLIVTDPV